MESNESIFSKYLRKSISEIREDRDKEDVKNNISEEIRNLAEKGEQQIVKRAEEYLNTLITRFHRNEQPIERYAFKLESRLVVDTSAPMGWVIDEVGLAWDPLLDCPYLPATTIKGVTRAVCEWDYTEGLAKILYGASDILKHKSVFSFFRGYPTNIEDQLLTSDVITPTYGDELKEHKAQPTPVRFITIAKGVTFECPILFNKNPKKQINDLFPDLKKLYTEKEAQAEIKQIQTRLQQANPQLFEKSLQAVITHLLKESFQIWGIGAKTSSGYGIFKYLPNHQ